MTNPKPDHKPTSVQEQLELEARRKAEEIKKEREGLKKDYSYFGHCKSLMRQIELDYRIAFFYTLFVSFIVCFTAMFKKRYQVFSCFAYMFGEPDDFVAIFCGGLSQILISLIVIIIGYMAWAHVRRCNLALFLFYTLMAVLGVIRADWPSALLGLGGVLFYLRALFSMVQDERICTLEGYPYFNERFELSKEDFVQKPWNPDPPDRDVAYMEALTRKSLRGEKEERKPNTPQVPQGEILPSKELPQLDEVIGGAKPLYAPNAEALPKLDELSLGEEPIKRSADAPKVALSKEAAAPSAQKPTPTEKSKPKSDLTEQPAAKPAPAQTPKQDAAAKPHNNAQKPNHPPHHKKKKGKGHNGNAK